MNNLQLISIHVTTLFTSEKHNFPLNNLLLLANRDFKITWVIHFKMIYYSFNNINLSFFSSFRIDNTDHIIDVNRNGQTGSEYDQVRFSFTIYSKTKHSEYNLLHIETTCFQN